MKKKTLFSLALASVLMVGCQQDEFVSLNEDTSVNLGNRPELGQVSFGWELPSTRMDFGANGYSYIWEEGDKLGAAIVDQLNATVELYGKDNSAKGGLNCSTLKWSYVEYVNGVAKTVPGKNVKVTAKEAGVDVEKFYQVVNYISSNYPYTLANSSWTTPANLVEGNYVFYAPYNQAHLTRQPIVVTLPMEQDCTEATKALKDFYKGTDPVVLATQFLGAPDNRNEVICPTPKLANIFAYPQITIKNEFNGYLFKGDAAKSGNYYSSAAANKYTMKLNKIEIYTTEPNAPMDYKRAVNVAEFKRIHEEWDYNTGKFTTGKTQEILSASSSYNVPDYPAYPTNQTDAAEKTAYATEYAQDGSDLISDYKVQHITCDLGGKELKNGEEYKFFAIMPAEDYGTQLYAKVYVEIDGVKYIMLNSDLNVVEDTKSANYGHAYFTNATTALADYNFSDPKHGEQGVRLVRGQRVPAAEALEDGSALKGFAGSLMTINLVGGKNQAAYAMKTTPDIVHQGIVDNADFINHITLNIQRGTSLVENADVEKVNRDKWNAQDIAFAENNTVTINAQLVKALYNTLYDKRPTSNVPTGDVLTLNTTQLPIANDVMVTLDEDAADTYVFTTLDGVSYKIKFDDTDLIGNTGTALINGINIVNAGATLKVAKNVTGAVVFVTGGTSTLDAPAGIASINVATNAQLTVNCSTDALITNEGTIVIGEKGALTNTNSVLKGTIDNSYLKAIAGNATQATVSANMIGWPTTTISATAKINALTINLGVEGALTINKAEVDKLANLNNVAITLGSNVTSIKSSASVTLTNIKSITAAESAIQWTTTANAITIYCGVTNPETNFFTNVASGVGVTFAK